MCPQEEYINIKNNNYLNHVPFVLDLCSPFGISHGELVINFMLFR